MSQLLCCISTPWRLPCKARIAFILYCGLWELKISHDTLRRLGAVFLLPFLPGTPFSSLSLSRTPLGGLRPLCFPTGALYTLPCNHFPSIPTPYTLTGSYLRAVHLYSTPQMCTVSVCAIMCMWKLLRFIYLRSICTRMSICPELWIFKLRPAFTTSFEHFHLPTILSYSIRLSPW